MSLAVLAAITHAQAAPRMISYGYSSCVSCHVSPQGRGLLNSYGRGIDVAQSYSKKDFTAMLLGRASGEDGSENWDGRFGPVLADVVATMRLNRRVDVDKTDPTITALYRQVVFLGNEDQFRINAEVGLLDGGLHDVSLGAHLTAVGGDNVFLKKLLVEWRIASNESSGKELTIGRDYLPLGLQIDDPTTYILHLNRSGIYDFPLQLKYFVWNQRSLASTFIFAPSFEEPSARREYGGGFLYEHYPVEKLAVGIQGLTGWADESDRLRIGPYLRWGISEKWALLAEVNYSTFWDVGATETQGSQVTSIVQLFYHHFEWLVSNATVNYAYSDLLTAKDHLSSFRYTLSARLNRNVSLGLTYTAGDILRNLGHGQEFGIFTTIKF